ncbi:Mini-ribonuclease 3 [Pullulanibacillus pueri]|uniref:Mini-ribonuclease 3 n=1 Tax=Pullulanibacillus pueri TaxID=1437324 RepID=A0A8J2ZXM6_9BACL|nr:ribonuclease III domain-containing protein [Pullulanibacillus pueri]GGH85451.1 mini-ribonuclease 3 [Pullulanibacillus pueri]
MNGLTLAYMGDAVIDLHVREHLIDEGLLKPNRLHKHAIQYVSAKAQASFLFHLMENEGLSEEEMKIISRGRNAKSNTKPKNTDVQTYRYGTAFEALIGYHYFRGNMERIQQLMDKMFVFHEKEGGITNG